MKLPAAFRVLLALFIALLSTASAVHEVAHTMHCEHEASAAISAPDHATDAGSCEFCAKGPTTSTATIQCEFECISVIAQAAEPIIQTFEPTTSLRTPDLRGPPTA